jgi:hypothetical protein
MQYLSTSILDEMNISRVLRYKFQFPTFQDFKEDRRYIAAQGMKCNFLFYYGVLYIEYQDYHFPW